MSLRSEEIDRIKFELGCPLTRIGAEPYISYIALFDKVIVPYLTDTSTTSATTIVAAASGAAVALALAANPAASNGIGLTFQVGTSVIVDVGPNLETSTIQSIAGLSATMTLTLAHSGTYPVVPVGAEQIVRDILARLDVIRVQLQTVAPLTSGVEAADEAKFFPAGAGRRGKTDDKFTSLVRQREVARNDLSDAIGFPNLRTMSRNASSRIGVY